MHSWYTVVILHTYYTVEYIEPENIFFKATLAERQQMTWHPLSVYDLRRTPSPSSLPPPTTWPFGWVAEQKVDDPGMRYMHTSKENNLI